MLSREPNRPPHQSASGICIESRWLHAHIHLVIGPDQDALDARKGPGPTPSPRPARPSRPSRAGRGRSRGCGVRETPGGGGAGSLIQADGISPDGIAGAVTGLGRLVIAARVVCAATRLRSSYEHRRFIRVSPTGNRAEARPPVVANPPADIGGNRLKTGCGNPQPDSSGFHLTQPSTLNQPQQDCTLFVGNRKIRGLLPAMENREALKALDCFQDVALQAWEAMRE